MECVEPLVYATHDYEMPGKGFLPLKANDVLYVIEADPSGWWLGKNQTGSKGVFPSTYTQPLLFRHPPESIQKTLAHLRRANDFQVDLVSGIPRPLHSIDAIPVAATPPSGESLEAMYALMNTHVLHREALRATVADRLTRLSALEHEIYACTIASSSASSPCPSSTAVASAPGGDAAAEATRLGAAVAQIEALRRDMAHQDCALPAASWYRDYHRVLKQASSSSAVTAATTCPRAFSPAELQLQDLQQRVAVREAALERLAPEVRQLEQSYLQQREALRRRIAIRDDLTTLYLSHWAELAESRRADYLQAKATNRSTEAGVEAEERRLQQCVQQGKEAFVALSEESRALNARAKLLRAQLMRKNELHDLEDRINTANETIASLRRRQRTSVVHAQ